MDTVFLSAPWLLAMAAAILALHIISFFLPKLRLPLTIVNVLLHTAFCYCILTAGGSLYEFVLVLLLSSFVSLLLGRIEYEKEAKAAEAAKKTEETEAAAK